MLVSGSRVLPQLQPKMGNGFGMNSGLWGEFHESLEYLELTICRGLDFEHAVDKNSPEGKEYFIGNWRKGDICYLVAQSLATLLPTAIWEVENITNKLGDLGKKI